MEKSKKWGMLGIVNQLFKIYFKVTFPVTKILYVFVYANICITGVSKVRLFEAKGHQSQYFSTGCPKILWSVQGWKK